MKLALLRFFARKPQALGCGCGAIFIAILAAVIAIIGSRCSPSGEEAPRDTASEAEPEAAPRLLLGRVWLDKLPRRATDQVDAWIFFAGGLGVHQAGSSYRASYDVIDFERRGSTLDGRYVQDKKAFKTSFTIEKCSGHEPFDLCLTLADVGGKKLELYGFSHGDAESSVPGVKATLAAAKARSDAESGSK